MTKLAQHLIEKNLVDFFNKLRPLLNADITVQPENTIEFTVDKYQNYFSDFNQSYQKDCTRGAEINVWQQSGLKQDEVRNTSVLAWWLDEQGSHGLGSQLFKAFVTAINKINVLPEHTTRKKLCCDGAYATYVESLPLSERENRIDVEIIGKNFLLFIEVKINATEGVEQLARYLSLLSKKSNQRCISNDNAAVVYLTTSTVRPKVDKGIYCISWQQVAEEFAQQKLPESATFTQLLLQQFCQHIKQF